MSHIQWEIPTCGEEVDSSHRFYSVIFSALAPIAASHKLFLANFKDRQRSRHTRIHRHRRYSTHARITTRATSPPQKLDTTHRESNLNPSCCCINKHGFRKSPRQARQSDQSARPHRCALSSSQLSPLAPPFHLRQIVGN